MFVRLEKAALALKNASDKLDPVHRLVRVAEHFPSGVIFTTSFGIEDQMIAHIIATEKLPFKIVTLDTGRFFPETYDLWQYTEEKYGLRIKAYYPNSEALSTLIADQGINGFYYSRQMREACCAIRKVAPLNRVLKDAVAWITGLRRDQSQTRHDLDFVLYDQERELLKINPLYNISRNEIKAYVEKHEIPVNILHKAGFLSIGCAPCTRAVQPGEDERAGRWWWEKDSARECGLHVRTDSISAPAHKQYRTFPV
ncbi:MAG: phosphoadenosine phosphosulfate reductase [Candidatus Tokpelaia sp. JSC085]|nr:MAG: phosphoadenosine phosphosulfate reductase [Candidatus Tokpelaia sp. JSC085]